MTEPIGATQRAFVLAALRGGLRVDGRSVNAIRRPTAHFGARTGQCEVGLGATRVLAVAECDVVEPTVNRPNDGFLTFHVVLPPIADFSFSQLGRHNEEALTLGRLLERVIKGSRAIDPEALCILAGRSVWTLRVEVTVLDNHGNVADCCVLGAILSLLHLRRPVVTVDGDQVIVHAAEAREPVPLSVTHVPVCVSHAMFDGGKLLVADPTVEEEACSTGRVLIGMNLHREICLLDYPGGLPISSKVFRQLPHLAFDKVEALTKFIDTVLREDRERRRTEAMPVYARKFYDERQRRAQADAGATPPVTDTAAAAGPPTTALADEDLLLGFLGRVVRSRRSNTNTDASPATAEGEPPAADGGEVEEGHTHDANVGLEDPQEEANDDGDQAMDVEEDASAMYQQQVSASGVEMVQVTGPAKKKKRRTEGSVSPVNGPTA